MYSTQRALGTAADSDTATSGYNPKTNIFPNVRVVPLHVLFGSEDILDHVGISGHAFYERLRASAALPTTSQPTPGEFLRAYEELASYDRIYSLHLSQKLSGTFQSAEAAAVALGGHLAAINSADENNFLYQNFSRSASFRETRKS